MVIFDMRSLFKGNLNIGLTEVKKAFVSAKQRLRTTAFRLWIRWVLSSYHSMSRRALIDPQKCNIPNAWRSNANAILWAWWGPEERSTKKKFDTFFNDNIDIRAGKSKEPLPIAYYNILFSTLGWNQGKIFVSKLCL